jgi:hypothetical protein
VVAASISGDTTDDAAVDIGGALGLDVATAPSTERGAAAAPESTTDAAADAAEGCGSTDGGSGGFLLGAGDMGTTGVPRGVTAVCTTPPPPTVAVVTGAAPLDVMRGVSAARLRREPGRCSSGGDR